YNMLPYANVWAFGQRACGPFGVIKKKRPAFGRRAAGILIVIVYLPPSSLECRNNNHHHNNNNCGYNSLGDLI
ncbi:MAG TPA: hypothetical protein VI233_00990, partial [Puia sp.]